MKKSKSKKKVAVLSEKDYEAYISSLKEERPTKVIVTGKTSLQNDTKKW